MVHYCNINKEIVENITYPIIRNLLQSSKYIDMEELLFQLNLRTQNKKIRVNQKKRSMIYAIKFHFKSFDDFINQSKEFSLYNENGKKYVFSNKLISSDWVIIDDY